MTDYGPAGKTMFDFYTKVLGMNADGYRCVLPTLLQIQIIVYELDHEGEKVDVNRTSVELCWNSLEHFLKSRDLWSVDASDCLNQMKRYAEFEEKLHQNYRLSDDEILEALRLKSSDIALMQYVATIISRKRVSLSVVRLFRLVNVLREIFDDVVDYGEDALHINFNVVALLVENHGIRQGIERVTRLIDERRGQIVDIARLIGVHDVRHRGEFLREIDEEITHHLEILRSLESRLTRESKWAPFRKLWDFIDNVSHARRWLNLHHNSAATDC